MHEEKATKYQMDLKNRWEQIDEETNHTGLSRVIYRNMPRS